MVNTELNKSQIPIPDETKTQLINEIEKNSMKSMIELNLGDGNKDSDTNTRLEKFYYVRRKLTYVEHLIFVFHSQKVFFMLFTILYF